MYWNLIWKSLRFVSFLANLIHFGAKSDQHSHRWQSLKQRTWENRTANEWEKNKIDRRIHLKSIQIIWADQIPHFSVSDWFYYRCIVFKFKWHILQFHLKFLICTLICVERHGLPEISFRILKCLRLPTLIL